MDTNARIDYFRSEIDGKIQALRNEMIEHNKLVAAKFAELEKKIDSALRELHASMR
jgi:hypothetical protein